MHTQVEIRLITGIFMYIRVDQLDSLPVVYVVVPTTPATRREGGGGFRGRTDSGTAYVTEVVRGDGGRRCLRTL